MLTTGDQQLVKNVQEKDCEDSLKELINRHSKLCYKVFTKYSGNFPQFKIDTNDFYTEKDLLIYRAAKSYRSDKKTKFSTWLGNHARFICLNTIKKQKKSAAEDNDVDNLLSNMEETKKSFDPARNFQDTLSDIKAILSELKDERIFKIFELRYSDEKMNWSNIGKEMNLCRSWCKNLHNRGINLLKKKFKI